MDNKTIWFFLIFISIVFGILDHIQVLGKNKRVKTFMEIWRHSTGFFVATAIGYYMISIRWPFIKQGNGFFTSDLVLGLLFIVSVTGWLPYLIKNITEGINAILNRALNK